MTIETPARTNRQQHVLQTVDRFKSAQPVDGLHQQDRFIPELIVLSQLQEPAKSPLQVVSLVSRPACITQPERFV